jgi:6-phosphofructokinase 1
MNVSKEIKLRTGLDTRVTILGHIQRGGTPTAFDRIVASRMGFKAVELLMEGKSGVAVGIKENKIYSIPLEEALNVEKVFDEKMFDIAKVLSI